MVKYTIRVDKIKDDTLESIKKFLEHDRYTRYLVYEEIADETKKIHYQGFVEFDDNLVGWHQERWSRHFKEYKQGSKSSAQVKKDEYLIYITKDKKKVLSKGCTDDFINTLETQSYHKVLTPQTKQKKQNYDFVKGYLEAMKRVPTDDRESLAEQSIEYFKEHSKIFDKFIIRRFVNLAVLQDEKINKDRYKRSMVAAICEDW